MSILNVNTIQPIGSGTTVTVAATELKTSNFITVGTGASVTSPSANVLTLGTNDTERFRITSAGLIGIGTVSPSGPIHAYVASGTQRSYLEASASHSFLRLKSGSTSYNSGVEFFSGASNIANVNGLGAGGLQFEVNGSERLRIESGGFVGLGTDNPYHELHIQGSSDTRVLITSGGTGDAVMMFENASGNTWGHGIDLTNNNYVIAYNNTSDPSLTADGILNITSSGNLGVSNADPTQAKLVAQTTSGSSLAAIKDNTGASIVIGGVTQPRILMEAGHNASEFKIYTAGGSSYGSAGWTERLRVTSGGNLQLYAGGNLQMASNGRIFVGNGGNATDPMFANVSDTNTGIAFPAADTMMFTTGGTERLRITTSGHVLRPTMAAAAVTLSTGLTTLSTFNGSYQSLAIDSEGFDNANNYNTTNYRFTAPETGFYQVGCNVQLEGGVAANTNSWMYLYPTINGSAPGTANGGNQADFDPRDTHYYNFTYTTLLKLSQNDYVQWKYTGNLSSIKLKGQGESIFYFYQVG